MQDLLAGWRLAVGRTGPDVDAAAADLLARWVEPHRYYHNVEHLTAVLSTVDEYCATVDDPGTVRLAAWFHDAVYDPRAAPGDNEEASAALASSTLAGLGLAAPAWAGWRGRGTAVAEVARLVRLTATHDPAPGDRNGALLCDADLAVLARPAARYAAYAAAIRREYAHVPEPAFWTGRAAVLRHLLELPALFRTPALYAAWEEPARANLRRELGSLTERT
ncbi:MAG TPA: metal-dependent phosphohydrolase [Micromonosporaceae bacterium]|jgi:predicted metal-dependent HD superfamily phosphohydrolase|nr:metal-dependent phosphohydrolase [Micromonosporaceae bacterium]